MTQTTPWPDAIYETSDFYGPEVFFLTREEAERCTADLNRTSDSGFNRCPDPTPLTVSENCREWLFELADNDGTAVYSAAGSSVRLKPKGAGEFQQLEWL
jgi:hypothetical protein